MRLDKFLCDALGTTRKEATQLLKSGEVTVDDVVQKSGAFKLKETSCVEWQGREITLHGPRYIMMHNRMVWSARMRMVLTKRRLPCLMKLIFKICTLQAAWMSIPQVYY